MKAPPMKNAWPLFAHALAYALRRAERLPADKRLLVNLSGRGDKDIDYVLEKIGL